VIDDDGDDGDDYDNNNSITFYLRAVLNRHWPVRVGLNTNDRNVTAQDETNKKQQRNNRNKEKRIGLSFQHSNKIL
jgi:hypothetical protein